MIVPTVEFVLDATLISNGIHRWPTEGGAIEITADELRQALENAYDPTMPNWTAMVEIDDLTPTTATSIKVYPHLWPKPICDRPPTAEDGDHEGAVQYLNHEGRWASGSWEHVANNFGKCPWLHCPQWRMDWSDEHTLACVVPLVPAPTNA
jgi:hypothetical protein